MLWLTLLMMMLLCLSSRVGVAFVVRGPVRRLQPKVLYICAADIRLNGGVLRILDAQISDSQRHQKLR